MSGLSIWLTDEQIQNLIHGGTVTITVRPEVLKGKKWPRQVRISGLNKRQRENEARKRELPPYAN